MLHITLQRAQNRRDRVLIDASSAQLCIVYMYIAYCIMYNRSAGVYNMNAAGIEGIAETGGCHTLLTDHTG